MNTLHADFEPLMLTSIQNATGLAIATITSMHSKRIFEDVKSNCKFFTLLGDYLYNTSKVLPVLHLKADLHVFLKIWHPIFTKTHNGNIFHYHDDNYKYDPACQLVL